MPKLMPKSLPLNPRLRSRLLPAAASAGLVLLAGTSGWLAWSAQHHPAKPAPKLVYTANGYGGFVPAPSPVVSHKPVQKAHRHIPVPDPVQPLREAYNAGHYQEMEAAAQTLVAQTHTRQSLTVREQAAQAGSLLAYAAARRHDLKLARTRFALAQQQAATLPDKGKQADEPGQVSPTLEEDASYEHAVCTYALGDPQAAQAEYVAFMKHYPESPLVHAAVLRLQKMQGGDLLPAEEAVRQKAVQIAAQHQRTLRREASLCGPECLAELLRRRGERADVHALADQMHTSDRGTTLSALADIATRHGFPASGLALTQKGLAAQKLPVIALVSPGHYVLVDGVTAAHVTLWDPDAHGLGHGATQSVSLTEWQREWHGMTLSLAPAQTPVQTAHR